MLVSPSSAFVHRDPPCVQFPECAGCSLQDLQYDEQVRFKREFLSSLYPGLHEGLVEVVPAPREFRYRNKAELAWKDGSLGFRRKGEPRCVFQINDCLLLDEGWKPVVAFLAGAMASGGTVGGLDEFRYAILKDAKRTGERMVGLTTRSEAPVSTVERIAEELVSRFGIRSVIWAVNPRCGDSAEGEIVRTWGSPTISDRLLDCIYEIELYTFFQPNPPCAEVAIAAMMEHVRPGMRVLDACCGVGTIGIIAAKRGALVTGYEISPRMIEIAWRNAAANGVGTMVKFESGRIRAMLKFHKEPVDLAIVDPPRSGLSPKVCERLAGLNAAKILYLSCGPKSQAQDIAMICSKGYKITALRGFDFFPQTPHVECLAVLEKA